MVLPVHFSQTLLCVNRTGDGGRVAFTMRRRTLIIFLLFAGLKTGRIRVVIDGSREETAEVDVVEGEDADFYLTAIKKEAPVGAPRRAFLTHNPDILRPRQHLSHQDCVELPIRFHLSGDADIFLCPDQLQQLRNQTKLIRFGYYVPI